MPLLPPQRKRPWFVRVAVVNRGDVLNKGTAVALSTAGWPDKTIRAIQSKQPDRFKASAAPLSRHLKRQEGRGRLDSKTYSVARICELTCHELHTPKLHMRCRLLVLFCSIYIYILCKHFFMDEGFRWHTAFVKMCNQYCYLSSFICPRVVPTSFSFFCETQRCCISFNMLLLKITRQNKYALHRRE